MWRALVLLFLLAAPAGAQPLYDDYSYEEYHQIAAIDERPINFYLDRPEDGEKVPLLVMVDGSGCVGQLRPRNRHDYRPGPGMPARYARLMVEKPGVEPDTDWGMECSETFLRNYSITTRVLDHLRVFQHLRATADWWNGDIYLWGWSDGGDIATQLVVYDPSIKRAVLGAMGGGLTMKEHFEQFWACPEGTEQRDACLEDLRADFKAIEDNPSRVETWGGESRHTWDSRLKSRLTAPLVDNRVPILIVHGEIDSANTPVESARALVDHLVAARNPSFLYWEVAGMDHGWGNLPAADQAALRLGMLRWLFGEDVAAESLPAMTDRAVLRPLPAAPEPL